MCSSRMLDWRNQEGSYGTSQCKAHFYIEEIEWETQAGRLAVGPTDGARWGNLPGLPKLDLPERRIQEVADK